MLKIWNDAVVTDINIALYVAKNTGKTVHTNRQFYGFVINDSQAEKIIHFSDGISLRTGPNEFHFLPKGSSYRVETLNSGGCWAINFDLLNDIDQKPFKISFKNHETVVNIFKDAALAWKEKKDFHNALIKKCIYEIIVKVRKSQQQNYLPSEKELLIKPAVDTITREFTRNNLSVKELSELCGISEAYLRRIFIDKFSLSPKEYIIKLRMDYAKNLLESGQFSINQIAQICGYFEPCHFSREFSRFYGVSPKNFKKL